jgi:hypothetical protein
MKTVWNVFKQMAAQKKFQAAVLAGLAWAGGKFGLQLSTEDLVPLVGPLWLYVFGQGLADFGKSAKQLEQP